MAGPLIVTRSTAAAIFAVMTARHILVVAVDGLRASALGAYGNTAYGTPALDKLATDSFLFDSCFAPTAELPAVYRALWQSLHPLRTNDYAAGKLTLPDALAERDYQSILLTDAADVAEFGAAAGFGECVQISGDPDMRTDDISQTALARLFADACDIVAAPSASPQLVWVHARGMYGPWDAPLELQGTLLAEGDPPPVHTVAAPDLLISNDDDPDTAFRYGVAYGAQVMVLDACWDVLGDTLTAGSSSGEWLVMLLGVRGFPLGEHLHVGGVDARLFAEQLHVPWLLRFPDATGRLARSGRLVSPLDLLPSLLTWADRDGNKTAAGHDGSSVLPLIGSKNCAWRDALLSTSVTGNRAIRTPGWSLVYKQDESASQLFVRPDDRWEANDVAPLCPEVVDGLVAAKEDASARICRGEPMPDEPLAEELRRSVN
jgi:arylsulfatase A-like enzyme